MRTPTAGPLAWGAAALALIATTVVPEGWVQVHLALRFALVFAFCALGLPFLWWVMTRRDGGPRTTAGRVATVFAIWAVVCALLASHPAISLLGQFDQGTGAVFLLALVAAWALGASIGGLGPPLLRRALEVAVGLNAAVTLLNAVVGLSGLGISPLEGRAAGLWSNPVFLCGFLAAGSWLYVTRLPESPWWGVGIAAAAAGVELSGTRFGLVVLLVAAVAALFTVGVRRGALAAACIVAGLVLGSGLGGLTAGAISGTSRAVEGGSSGLTPRLEMWMAAGHAVNHSPIVGSGPALFREATGPRRTLKMARSEGPDRVFEDAHDIVVELAVSVGIPGVLLFLCFLVVSWRCVDRTSPLAGFSVLVFMTAMFQPQHGSLTCVAFLALGAAAAAGEGPTLRAWSWAPLGSLALVASVVVSAGNVALRGGAPTYEGATARARTARHLLPAWADAFDRARQIEGFRYQQTNDPAALGLARRWAFEAVRRQPDNAPLWRILAAIDGAQGHLDLSESDLRNGLRFNPWSVEALKDLANVLEHQGDHAGALEAIAKAQLVAPTDPSLARLRRALDR